MQDQIGSQNPSGDPNGEASSQVALIAAIEKRVVALESQSHANENATENIERDKIKKGERWLISINFFLIIVQIIIAYIYYGQLQQMRMATEAATKAANVAADSFEINNGNFDRMMEQTIHQTFAQLESSGAARREAKTVSNTLAETKRESNENLNKMGEQIGTAQKANAIAEEALDAQTRPWVGIVGEVIPVSGTETRIPPRSGEMPIWIDSIDVKFRIQNYGGSVATQVATVFMLYNGTKPNQGQFNSTHVCQGADSDSSKSDWLVNRISIFPKEISGEIQKTARCWVDKGCRRAPNYLVACISYQRDQMIYHTQLEYVVRYADPNPETGIQNISAFDLTYTGTDAIAKQQSQK
jgi:hypothetical protein